MNAFTHPTGSDGRWFQNGPPGFIGVVNAVIITPFSATSWFVQAVAAAVVAVVTLPYGVPVGVLLCLDLRARKESLTLKALGADLQASAA